MVEDQRELNVPVGPRDHALGDPDAPVTLVEYGDYECPYCLRAFPVVKRLSTELAQSLRVVFRHFPRNSVHPRAGAAAQAAEAAGAQGRFWAMHELLYENQDQLADADFTHFALRLGLEVYKFQADLEREDLVQRIAEDFRSGLRSGVNQTPTFFINGKRYTGQVNFDAMRQAIESAAATNRAEGTE